MDYVITSRSKKLYIKLNKAGYPETCTQTQAQRFENSKAKNILDNLPKTLKKFNFKVEPIPDLIFTENKSFVKEDSRDIEESIKSEDYELPEGILIWESKFGTCFDIFEEAKLRVKNLVKDLGKYDNELLDILHSIELEKSKDLYNGWKLYKKIKENRKRRRKVKDEIIILDHVLGNIDSTYLNRDRIKKAIDGLFKRKYKFRVIEEEENNDL